MVNPWISPKKILYAKWHFATTGFVHLYIILYIYMYLILYKYILSRYYFWSDHIALAIQDISLCQIGYASPYFCLWSPNWKTRTWAPPLCEHQLPIFTSFIHQDLQYIHVQLLIFVDICCISISVSVIFRRLIIWLNSTFLGNKPQCFYPYINPTSYVKQTHVRFSGSNRSWWKG